MNNHAVFLSTTILFALPRAIGQAKENWEKPCAHTAPRYYASKEEVLRTRFCSFLA
jgi:hypothetical protein